MRRSLVIAGLCLLAVPAFGYPVVKPGEPPPVGARECKRLTRQIAHYGNVADMAHERGDAMWEQATLNHISQLSTRRAQLCPQYASKPAGEELLKMLKNAAKIAYTLFTLGLI
jgi:hypothetical protein